MESAGIQRHKTAIRRGDFSRPVKCLLRDGLLGKDVTFFDYGCGRGEDLELLSREGVTCSGWDPAFQPDAVRQEADVVNLGYVINVIEKPDERAETLRMAWGLCRQVLAVSAQVLMAGRGEKPRRVRGRGADEPWHVPEILRAARIEELPRRAAANPSDSRWNRHLLPVQGRGETAAVPRQPLPPAGDSATPPDRRAAAGRNPPGPGTADGGHRRPSAAFRTPSSSRKPPRSSSGSAR